MQLVFLNLPFSLECIWPIIGTIQDIDIWILINRWCHPSLQSSMRELCLTCRTNVRRRWKKLLNTRYLVTHIIIIDVHTRKPIIWWYITIQHIAVHWDGFKVLIQCLKMFIKIIITIKIARGFMELLSSKLIRTHDVFMRRRNVWLLYRLYSRIALILWTRIEVHVWLGVNPLWWSQIVRPTNFHII